MTPALGVQLARPLSDEAQVQFRFEVAVEVVSGNKVLPQDGDGQVEAPGFGRAEHGEAPGQRSTQERAPCVVSPNP
jgi:hypothetical protein